MLSQELRKFLLRSNLHFNHPKLSLDARTKWNARQVPREETKVSDGYPK